MVAGKYTLLDHDHVCFISESSSNLLSQVRPYHGLPQLLGLEALARRSAGRRRDLSIQISTMKCSLHFYRLFMIKFPNACHLTSSNHGFRHPLSYTWARQAVIAVWSRNQASLPPNPDGGGDSFDLLRSAEVWFCFSPPIGYTFGIHILTNATRFTATGPVGERDLEHFSSVRSSLYTSDISEWNNQW